MENREFINITRYGAHGDGLWNNSAAFAEAFKESGSHITVPAGLWLTGPITLSSDSTLNLEEGAVLKFIDDPALYPPVYTRWEGQRCYAMHPCIYAENKENVTVSGKGVVDGSGKRWWTATREKQKNAKGPETKEELALAALNPGYLDQPSGGGGRYFQFLRPDLVQFNGCRNVNISGVRLMNSPFWTLHPVFTDGLTIDDITIFNPSDSPNTDAIDVDSCSRVVIRNSYINVGDDGICIKSGAGEDGIIAARPTYDVLVEGCTVCSSHGGAAIGSETAAGIRDVTFRNCAFIGTDRGIRLKTRRGRGGIIENLKFQNIAIDGCLCPFTFNMYYKCGATDDSLFSLDMQSVTESTPAIRNVLIENVVAMNCRSSAGFIVGLPESRIENVIIRNTSVSIDPESDIKPNVSEMYRGIPDVDEKGIRIRFADAKLENVVVEGVEKIIVEE